MQAALDAIGLGQVATTFETLASDGLGGVLVPMLDGSVEDALAWLGPETGKVVVEKMSEKYSQFGNMEGAKDTAVSAASDAVMSFKDEILEFIGDVIDDPSAAFKKVGALMLRACKEAVNLAVQAVINYLGACVSCCVNIMGGTAQIIQSAYETTRDALLGFVKEQLEKRSIPQALLDLLPWDFDPDDDVGKPSGNHPRAPRQQAMEGEENDGGNLGGLAGEAAVAGVGVAGAGMVLASAGEDGEEPAEQAEEQPEEAPEEEQPEEQQEEAE